jgi:ubiquinone/menaquinone biosynthesis C-methylase UbiE
MAPELLDDPAQVLEELPANLRDIRRLNRWFGGTRTVVRHVDALLAQIDQATILDVATGSADIPLALWRWGLRKRKLLRITAMDHSPEILAEAEKIVGGSGIELTLGDAQRLPWAEDSFDVVTCCLALHHFPPAQARVALAEMWRVARRAVLVADLERGRASYLGVWLATHTVARNRLTRHDGPLSVLRAYTPREAAELAAVAGLENIALHRHVFFRFVLIAQKEVAP